MLMVNAYAGCLAGDTLINVNRAKKGSKMTIEKLVKQFNGEKVLYQRSDNGAYASMRPWNLEIPTYVSCCIGNEVKLGLLKNAWFSGVKDTFKITTENGRSIRATDIHPFLSDNNIWYKVKDLKVGMAVMVNIGKSSKGRTSPKRNYQYCMTNFHPNQINNGNGFKVAKHRLVVEADMNCLDFNTYIHILRKDENTSKYLKYLDRAHVVHHKDEDHTNNKLDNLEVLVSQKEHSQEHNWSSNVLDKIGTDVIKSIEPFGREKTYDLELNTEPHNFIANDFVVHNTGKTTTVIFGLGGRVPKGMILSDEQKEIIKVMRSYKWESAAAMAFNTSIADELKRRVPPGVVAATSNSFGNTAWRAFAKSKVDGSKTNIIFREIAKNDGLKWEEMRVFEPDVVRLVSLMKGHLLDGTENDIADMAEQFNIELTPQIVKYADLCFQKGLAERGMIDFDDQIFMPLKLNIPIPQYDLVVVDESQDLNFAKQELAIRMAKKWLVAIGDSNQAIYGFSGADSASMFNLGRKMADRGKLTKLKLTITRRCPKSVVKVANKYVPDLKAHKDAPEGEVRTMKESLFLKSLIDAKSSRMVLCRTNAPLTSLAFKLIANKRRCFIQGKDIGAGLVRLVEKAKGLSFQEKVAATCEKLNEKILSFKGDILKADKIEALEDKIFCINILAADCDSIEAFKEVTEKLFKNKGDENDHILSSVHKAKGLEHPYVCIYKPSKLPMILSGKKKKQSQKQVQQEYNLAYVAYTRSQDILEFIEEEKEKNVYGHDEEF